jgi:hypothetical protein
MIAGLPTFPRYGGLKLVDVDVSDPGWVLTVAYQGESLVYHDAGHYTVLRHRGHDPKELAWKINPTCTIGGYVNAASVPKVQPKDGGFVYKPHEKAIWEYCAEGHSARWITDRVRKIEEGHPGWWLFNLANLDVARFVAEQFRGFFLAEGLAHRLLDELSPSLWSWVKGQTEEEQKAWRLSIAVTDDEYETGARIMTRNCGGGAPNGPWPEGMSSIKGRMIQNVVTDPWDVRKWRDPMAAVNAALRSCDARPVATSDWPILLQNVYTDPETLRFQVCLAALVDGMSQQSDPWFRSAHNPKPWAPGSWGVPEDYLEARSTVPDGIEGGNLPPRVFVRSEKTPGRQSATAKRTKVTTDIARRSYRVEEIDPAAVVVP